MCNMFMSRCIRNALVVCTLVLNATHNSFKSVIISISEDQLNILEKANNEQYCLNQATAELNATK